MPKKQLESRHFSSLLAYAFIAGVHKNKRSSPILNLTKFVVVS